MFPQPPQQGNLTKHPVERALFFHLLRRGSHFARKYDGGWPVLDYHYFGLHLLERRRPQFFDSGLTGLFRSPLTSKLEVGCVAGPLTAPEDFHAERDALTFRPVAHTGTVQLHAVERHLALLAAVGDIQNRMVGIDNRTGMTIPLDSQGLAVVLGVQADGLRLWPGMRFDRVPPHHVKVHCAQH